MFLNVDSEMLIRGFVDSDLELLANRILEVFYVISVSSTWIQT